MKEPRVWQTVLQREQWFPWKQRQVKFTSKGSFFMSFQKSALSIPSASHFSVHIESSNAAKSKPY